MKFMRTIKKLWTGVIESPPELTKQMRWLGFHWVKTTDGKWVEACDVCGGNCGQCGTSLGRGVPASLGQIVHSSGMDKKRPYGFGGMR